jgi:hypothetical protein
MASTREEISAADDKTLRLAAPELTTGRLEAFVRYLERLGELLEATASTDAAALAACHQQALAASGLNPGTHAVLSALVADFAARRGAVLQLREKLAGLAEGSELGQKLSLQLRRLQPVSPLERRYGAEAVALLMTREAQVVALQTRTTRLLAR